MGVAIPWPEIFAALRERVRGDALPSVSAIAEKGRDPFRVLVATMISLRTKDEVTSAAAARLFARADNPHDMLAIAEDEIAGLIYPAGFYRNKARHIKDCCRLLVSGHDGKVPTTREELVRLPGVGIKTANLTLNLGFGIQAICVDTHVHRISNRLGWVATKDPDKTVGALEAILPRRYWIEINALLVSYGKNVCTPLSPFCSTCPLEKDCPRIGVQKHR